MTEQLKGRLSPVLTRQHWMTLFRYAVAGLMVGSLVAIAMGVARLLGASIPPLGAVSVAFIGMLAGVGAAFIWRPDFYNAAFAVDDHYRLKDRSATALHFANRDDATDFHRLQVADAVTHLKCIDAKEVTPFTMPRLMPFAFATFAAAIVLVCIPVQQPELQAKVFPPDANILSIADDLQETMLDELEELVKEAEEGDDKDLKELIAELDELVEEMKEPGVDEKEALAKLSEMQAAVAAAQAEFNMDVVENSMQALGESLAAATAMQGAANALKEGEYEKAADELEAVDPAEIAKKEAKSIAKELKKLAQTMGEAGLGQLSTATTEFTEGLESGEESQCKGGACKLAKVSRKVALRKKVGECLGCQLAKLGECKGQCKNGKNGGKGANKSDTPKNQWGRGSNGNPFGDEATRIDSRREQDKITGTPGDGPSEREVTHSPEGRQNASREYRQNYKDFKKATEEVLRGEALPLGHRQTIRRYFESIRPDNETDTEAATDAEATGANATDPHSASEEF